jgi:class 3 adenylate cyclase
MGFLNLLNLRSKLIAALLAAGALTGLTQAWLGNENVRSGFQQRLDGRLKAVVAMTNSEVELFFQNTSGLAKALGSNVMISDAIDAMVLGARSIDRDSLTAEMDQKLQNFYNTSFVDSLAKASGSQPVAESYLPETNQTRYLQYLYIANNPDAVGRKEKLDAASDAGAYSNAHFKYHPSLRAMRDAAGVADLMLISPNGDVVYTVAKEVDFQTNLIFGAFNNSGLARAFKAAREQRSSRPVVVEDFSFYEPSYGAPAAFVATPVFSGKEFKGVVVIQLSSQRLNAIVTKNKGWKNIGLGETGDIYIVGQDRLYRTTARQFEEQREEFLAASAKSGSDKSMIARMEAYGTPIKLQATESAEAARRREATDSVVRTNALGTSVTSYAAPLKIPGLDWVTVAEVSTQEANRQTVDFQKLMMIALAITTAITTIGAMMLSGLLTRPVRALTEKLSAVAAGDLETPVAMPRGDEIGDLSRSAQQVVDGFRYRLAEVAQQHESTAALLNRFLPDGIVRLITSRSGEEVDGQDKLDDISEVVPNATFVFGRFFGFDTLFDKLSPEQVVKTLDQFVQVIDVAADKHGVEKIRTAGDTYFAVCGLSTPHLDHRQRGLAFSKELHAIAEKFGRDADGDLQVKIGVASGSAISGVVGREKLAFDVWGKPVSESEMLNDVADLGEIRVTREFAESLKDAARFVADPSKPGMRLDLGDTTAPLATAKKKNKA